MQISKIFFFLTVVLIGSCTLANSQKNASSVPVQEFYEQIRSEPQAVIVDVRSAGEFAGGYLDHALNIDWNASDFKEKLASIDKDEKIYVYCLSGIRSASAADYMRKAGYTNVVEMDGGMIKWRAANLPEIKPEKHVNAEYSSEQYNSMVTSDKLVLVDFYAKWCAPCKKMEPFLHEISTSHKEILNLVRIDYDKNGPLAKSLGIDALPVLKLYKDGVEVWSHRGFIGKDEILTAIKEF